MFELNFELLNNIRYFLNTMIVLVRFSVNYANERPREDARLRGGTVIEPCAIVPGAKKISNGCNI